MVNMELSFKDLKKREVINLADGSSFGHITDLVLSFPKGNLVAIVVPGKRGGGIFGFFSRSSIRIEEKNIIKIGGDVILVNIRCGDSCSDSVNINPVKPAPQPRPCSPVSPCPPGWQGGSFNSAGENGRGGTGQGITDYSEF